MGNIRIIPESASNFSGKVDLLFWTMTALTVIFTLIVMLGVGLLAVRYRRGHHVDRSNPLENHHILEATWLVVPLVLGLAVFGWGATIFAEMRQPPKDALEIFVIGKRWMWHIQHSNGVREMNRLHIPIGKPVKLTMISQDVIHDFFVPDFRIHQDVIPGHYTTEWFTPTELGDHRFFCAQYCGTNHSEMVGIVTVMPLADYEKWLARGGFDEEPPPTMEEAGKQIYDAKLCGSCHGAMDTVRAPSLVGIYGTPRKLTTGQTVLADDEYIRRSVVDPYAQITAGYAATMPEYKELTEEQVLQLMAYIKSLGVGPASKPRGATGRRLPSGNIRWLPSAETGTSVSAPQRGFMTRSELNASPNGNPGLGERRAAGP